MTCYERPPVLRDHYVLAEGVVFQDRFYCNVFGKERKMRLNFIYFLFKFIQLSVLKKNFNNLMQWASNLYRKLCTDEMQKCIFKILIYLS